MRNPFRAIALALMTGALAAAFALFPAVSLAEDKACATDADCSAPQKCLGTVTHLVATADQNKSCQIACTKDTDCPAGQKCTDFTTLVTTTGACKTPATTGGQPAADGQGATRDNQILSGSVLTLPLPLGNISLPSLIGRVIKQILSIVGALALLFFVWGGLKWMLARGAADEIAKAKKIIVAAVSGLIAIFTSYAILDLILKAISK